MMNGPLPFHVTNTPDPPLLRSYAGALASPPGRRFEFQTVTEHGRTASTAFSRALSTLSATAYAAASGSASAFGVVGAGLNAAVGVLDAVDEHLAVEVIELCGDQIDAKEVQRLSRIEVDPAKAGPVPRVGR